MYCIFNPDYILKPDEGRVLIMSKFLGRDNMNYIDETFTSFIHPVYAKLLCFFDGRKLSVCVKEAADYLNTSKEKVVRLVNRLLNNVDFVESNTKSGTSLFPPFTLITRKHNQQERCYNPEQFDYTSIDLQVKRHYTPSEITLMVNNVCATNCIYCYEDKSKIHNCQIPLERIKELIAEAKQLNVRTFDVIGGEYFLYKYWKEVLEELLNKNFHPYLSTKLPLSETMIETLAIMGIKDIQISLDTLDASHLSKLLDVQSLYCEKMKYTLYQLNKYGIPVKIHSVLAKVNGSIADMSSIYECPKL